MRQTPPNHPPLNQPEYGRLVPGLVHRPPVSSQPPSLGDIESEDEDSDAEDLDADTYSELSGGEAPPYSPFHSKPNSGLMSAALKTGVLHSQDEQECPLEKGKQKEKQSHYNSPQGSVPGVSPPSPFPSGPNLGLVGMALNAGIPHLQAEQIYLKEIEDAERELGIKRGNIQRYNRELTSVISKIERKQAKLKDARERLAIAQTKSVLERIEQQLEKAKEELGSAENLQKTISRKRNKALKDERTAEQKRSDVIAKKNIEHALATEKFKEASRIFEERQALKSPYAHPAFPLEAQKFSHYCPFSSGSLTSSSSSSSKPEKSTHSNPEPTMAFVVPVGIASSGFWENSSDSVARPTRSNSDKKPEQTGMSVIAAIDSEHFDDDPSINEDNNDDGDNGGGGTGLHVFHADRATSSQTSTPLEIAQPLKLSASADKGKGKEKELPQSLPVVLPDSLELDSSAEQQPPISSYASASLNSGITIIPQSPPITELPKPLFAIASSSLELNLPATSEQQSPISGGSSASLSGDITILQPPPAADLPKPLFASDSSAASPSPSLKDKEKQVEDSSSVCNEQEQKPLEDLHRSEIQKSVIMPLGDSTLPSSASALPSTSPKATSDDSSKPAMLPSAKKASPLPKKGKKKQQDGNKQEQKSSADLQQKSDASTEQPEKKDSLPKDKSLTSLTSLWRAAGNGNLKTVEHFVNSGTDVNKPTPKGNTLLWIAARGGHLEIVKFLTGRGADANQPGQEGTTPLWMAAGCGHLKIVKFLNENGACTNQPDNFGVTPLLLAAARNCLEIVRFLVANGGEVNRPNNDGRTPLWMAAKQGYFEVVELLVANGADAHQCDKVGITPIRIADDNDHLAIVKLLNENGTGTNQGNAQGVLLAAAAAEASTDASSSVAVQSSTPTSSTKAVDSPENQENSQKDAEKKETEPERLPSQPLPLYIRILVRPADKTKKDKGSALPISSPSQDKDVASVVNGFAPPPPPDSQEGANWVDEYGLTPLHIAANNNHLKAVQCLVENGADINRPDKSGFTSLHIAVKCGYLKVVKYLITKGAYVNLPEKDGLTPLWIAASYGYIKIVKCLVENRADVNLPEKDGLTPLWIAASYGYIKIVKCLVENRADVNLRDSAPGMACILWVKVPVQVGKPKYSEAQGH